MQAGSELDVLVVGGGIVGACTARDAALRGLRVGLIDRADFGAGATANCLKIVHGGLRYLQHLDMRRMRESILERSYWLRAAPHLVEPLPVLMPTYRGQVPPRAAFAAALAINEVVSYDRNRGALPERRLPRGRVLSRQECVARIPELDASDLTGGVFFHDAIMYSPERLALEVVDAARLAGAAVASYVELEHAIVEHGRVIGARVRDVLRNERREVRARYIVNATGAHAAEVAGRITSRPSGVHQAYSIALNVVTRQPARRAAFTVTGGAADPDRVIRSGGRQLFVVPWRGQTMVGTGHLPLEGDPAEFRLEDRHIASFLAEIASAVPALNVSPDDVVLVHRGLLPIAAPARAGGIRLLKRHVIHDHASDGVRGAFSVVSVKYTTARRVAEAVVDRIAAVERGAPRGTTALLPLPGGDIASLGELSTAARMQFGSHLPDDVLDHLVRTYGGRYDRILAYRDRLPDWDRRVAADAPVIYAQLVHGVTAEYARTADDLLWRRTELGPRGLIDAAARRWAEQALHDSTGSQLSPERQLS